LAHPVDFKISVWRCVERWSLVRQAVIRGYRWASGWNATSASSCSRTTFLQCWSWCCRGSRSGSTTRRRQPASPSVSRSSSSDTFWQSQIAI